MHRSSDILRSQLLRLRLRNVEILLADIAPDRVYMPDRGIYVLFHNGAFYAASVTHGKLDKALVDIAVLEIV